MLDNLLERLVVAVESISDSLEIIAGGRAVAGSAPDVAAVVEDTTTVAEAKAKKPRGKKKEAVAPEPEAAAPAAVDPEPTAPTTAQLFAGSASSEPVEAMTLEQCNTILVNAVNSGAPASVVMDILGEYSPQMNLRFIEAIHYPEIARRVQQAVV